MIIVFASMVFAVEIVVVDDTSSGIVRYQDFGDWKNQSRTTSNESFFPLMDFIKIDRSRVDVEDFRFRTTF